MLENGFILIDKPKDWTSHDVVGYLRGVTKIKKIGHAGTLDPFATGLLIVGIGREATKLLDSFHRHEKTYTTKIKLGAVSDSQDSTGVITQYGNNIKPELVDVIKTLESFEGEQEQIPPMHSAKKVGGKKLYDLARKGIEIERQPNTINISNIELISYDFPTLEISVTCSTGTYIRTLTHDIGQALGTGAYCEELRRTSIGSYSVNDAHLPKTLSKQDIHRHLFFPSQTNQIDKNQNM